MALERLEGLVVLDEVQRKPELFALLRVLADRQPVKTRFLLTGSAAPAARPKSGLAVKPSMRFHPTVQKRKAIVAVLLVALWLPASSHAFLQHGGFIHQIHAHDGPADADHDSDSGHHHENDGDNHAAADGLCVVASGRIPLAKPSAVAPLPWLTVAVPGEVENTSAPRAIFDLSPPGVAPPELSPRWQFTSRAALPVRAPSFVF
jgi:hypothetical protein